MIPEMQLCRRRLDGLYVEAGRRAHIVARLDGSYGGFREVSKEIVNPPGGGGEGVWVEPLRLLDYVHFYIWDEQHGLASVERYCEQYVREVGYSRFVHRFASHPYLEVEKRVWVPRHHAAVVIGLILKNESDRDWHVRLFTECRSHLSLGWPRRDAGRDVHRFDADLQAILALDEAHPDWVAIWGIDRPPVAYCLGTFHPGLLSHGNLSTHGSGLSESGRACSCLQHDLLLPAAGEVRLNLVIAGGNKGQDQAVAVYRHVMAHAADLLEERIAHYQALMEDTVRLETPDYALNKAFLWAKAGTEDFKHFDPDFGLCYFAGFPAYNFYFASDSFRILHGAICAGDWDDTREILRMILSYQAQETGADTLPGEIWHEMSTTGDRISPNFCTLDFPPLLEHFYRWTGDRAFLEEIYPNLHAAVEWGYLMDSDGDGLLENGPEGEMADSAFEDTNMEGSHLGPNLAWVRALRAGARLARLVGDTPSAERWEETAAELGPRLNQLYWNETQRRFEETIRPNGCFDSSWRGITVIDAEAVDEGKARFGLDRLLRDEECLTDPEAFLRWKEVEKAYATWRAHLSYYVVDRGDRARLLLRNHLVDAGVAALRDLARLPFTVATPGHFPEVIGLDDLAAPYVRGCAHQAWSAACGIVYPVIEGLFGVFPDAASHSVTIDPHLPAGWPGMRLTGLRVGDHRLDIAYRRDVAQDDILRYEARLHNDGKVPLVARLGFPLPLSPEILTVTADGIPLDVQDPRVSIVPTPEDVHVYVETTVKAGETSTVTLQHRPAQLELVAASFLERAQPGTQTAVPLRLVNKGSHPVTGCLRLSLPEGWPGTRRPLEKAVDLGPDEVSGFTFDLEVPPAITEGYHTLWARFEGSPNVIAARPIYLPVFGSVEVRVDGRGVAKEGLLYTLRVAVSNLTRQEIEAEVVLDLPVELISASPTRRLALEPGGVVEAIFSLTTDQPGEFSLSIRVTAPGVERHISHLLRVVPRHRLFVLYSGFLGCPIASDDSLEVVNMPANYAVRKPHVMEQLLPQADVVLTSDQHDAIFTEEQIESLVRYVAGGGKLLLFCYWSSAWGRGFHDTYGNVADTKLAEILPLLMKRGIGQGNSVQLEGAGRSLFRDIEWNTCPPYDFNLAEARPEAEVWARSDDGCPLIACWTYGRGRVTAIAIDCFGYGSYGSFVSWPGVRAMIRQAVLELARSGGGVV
ncbi:MAG TPA: hypothetical protein EYP49_00225 [Anaerolineae bacterium]|nr:hypothetical protein [Anaerolineae bacterium]